jgi:hypothetical protein
MKAENKEEEEMNNKKLLNIIGGDRQLMGLFSGVVLSAFALLSVVVAAGVWYL